MRKSSSLSEKSPLMPISITSSDWAVWVPSRVTYFSTERNTGCLMVGRCWPPIILQTRTRRRESSPGKCLSASLKKRRALPLNKTAAPSAPNSCHLEDNHQTASGSAPPASSEAHKNRLRLQSYSPGLVHSRLNLVFQSNNVSRRCSTPIHNGKRMFARDPHVPLRVTLPESGVLHQPCCRNFLLLR